MVVPAGPRRCRAEAACTVMVAMLCATVSCSSRAMCSRSSATTRPASAARSSSASRSLVAVSAVSARRPRTTSPSVTASARMTIWDRKSRGQRGQSLPGAQLHHEQAGDHEASRDGDGPDQVAGHRRVVERDEEQRSGGDVPAGEDVVEEDQHRRGDHHLERPSVPEQNGQRQRPADQLGPEVERDRAWAAADDDVEFDDHDDQEHDDHVKEPDTERTFGHSPGWKTAPWCLRRRRAAHGVTLCDYRLERNARRDQRSPNRVAVFMPIASTRTAGSASHLMRLGESGTSSLVYCPGELAAVPS